MTDTSHQRPTESSAPYAEPVSAWAGWVVFGGVMMVLLGAFQIIEGLVALFDDGFYAVTSDGLVVDVDYNTWGWVHLAIGIIAVLTGLGLLAGNMLARVVGVGIAMLSAIVNLAFISAYPVWSTIMIVLNVIVIFAIVVHGRELKYR
ncbi:MULTISPECIES: DUF7144 family membrane protein [unclassified Blastococcus]